MKTFLDISTKDSAVTSHHFILDVNWDRDVKIFTFLFWGEIRNVISIILDKNLFFTLPLITLQL